MERPNLSADKLEAMITGMLRPEAEPTLPPKPSFRGRKRSFRKLPRPVYPVRALWDASTPEEKARAHRISVGIIDWWVGRRTKDETACRLGLTPLRLWQLSQRALSGMLAGLLHQPRLRGKVAPNPGKPADEVGSLKKETVELKKRLKAAENVASILQELRAVAEAPPLSVEKRKRPAPAKTAKPKKAKPKATVKPPAPAS